jgi:hypothetical protein
MRYPDTDVFHIAEAYNRTAKEAKVPFKLIVSTFEKGKHVRYNISMAHWDNHVIQTLQEITSSEAVAYIQGFGHLCNQLGNYKGNQ